MREIAYAKINLALHVRRRRDDGYHELETLFAFVDAGDVLIARPSERDGLTVSGEFAAQLTDPFGNLVTTALGKLPRASGLSLALEKNLPVAAGLGGGSADAGAVFRIIDALHGLPADWLQRAAALGADVPACVASRMCLGHGSGTDLLPIFNDLTGAPVILVNPRAPLATGAVFAGWSGEDRGPLPVGPASTVARQGRNDLEDSAVALVPEIADVLNALRRTDASVARMSGSGATCFAIYTDAAAQAAAAAQLSGEHPGWWIMEGTLRP